MLDPQYGYRSWRRSWNVTKARSLSDTSSGAVAAMRWDARVWGPVVGDHHGYNENWRDWFGTQLFHTFFLDLHIADLAIFHCLISLALAQFFFRFYQNRVFFPLRSSSWSVNFHSQFLLNLTAKALLMFLFLPISFCSPALSFSRIELISPPPPPLSLSLSFSLSTPLVQILWRSSCAWNCSGGSLLQWSWRWNRESQW